MTSPTPLKPRRLAPGQLIGIVAPASPPNELEAIRFAIDTIESLVFRVRPAAHLFDRSGYLAGDDAARAADLNELFADESVDAIFCLRGGYGSSRLLPLLDFERMRANPKVLLGYSDITSLLLSIFHKTGLVTFHGPIAAQTITPYTLAEFNGLAPDEQVRILQRGFAGSRSGSRRHQDRKQESRVHPWSGKPRPRRRRRSPSRPRRR